MIRWSLLLSLSIGVVWTAESAAPRSIGELEEAIEAVLTETATPAAGVALVNRDGVTWSAGIGTADVAAGRPAEPETLFRVGSISKSFVAAAVLLLVEEGKLALEDRVAELAPEIPFSNPWENSAPLRVVHLLEHSSGFDDIHLVEYAHQGPQIGLREALQYHPDSRISRAPPGEHYSYANSGPGIAAYLVEKLSGEPFESFVARRIFAPLGMSTASWILDPQTEAHLARGYWGDGVSAAPYEHVAPRPAGALNASPVELGRFVRMLINRGRYEGGRLLAAQSIERMERPVTTLAAQAGIDLGYGLGNYASIGEGLLWHGHAGGLSNFLARYAYLPEQGVGYVFMINAPNAEAYQRIEELLRAFLTVDLTRPRGPEPVRLPVSQLQRWAGFYQPIMTRPELARFITNLLGVRYVGLRDGELLMLSAFGGRTRLLPLGEGRFRLPQHPVASVAFIKRGGETLIQGEIVGDGSLRRIPAWSAWLRWIAALACGLLMASALLYLLLWLPRLLFGHRYLDLGLRLLPLAAVLALAGCFGLFLFTEDIIGEFGRPTLRAHTLWLLGWLFALLSLLALWRSLGGGSAGLRVHSALVSLACLATTAYLYYWGVLGLRTWEY